MTDHRTRTTDPFAMAIRAADTVAELGRLRAIVAEIYAGAVDAREGLMGEIDVRADVIAARRKQADIVEHEGWYRVRPTYRKPSGGFLAIGPRYRGNLVEDGTAVRFRQGPESEWYETVPIVHLEVNPEPRQPRRR